MFTTSFWKYVIEQAKMNKSFGSQLSTSCQQHPEKKTVIASLNDFSLIEDGGCNEPCTVRLACGHVCPKRCHPDTHDGYLCTKTCDRYGHDCNPPRECQHRCKQLCYKPCGPCSIQAEKVSFVSQKNVLICSAFLDVITLTMYLVPKVLILGNALSLVVDSCAVDISVLRNVEMLVTSSVLRKFLEC